jgi:hypothetical protein
VFATELPEIAWPAEVCSRPKENIIIRCATQLNAHVLTPDSWQRFSLFNVSIEQIRASVKQHLNEGGDKYREVEWALSEQRARVACAENGAIIDRIRACRRLPQLSYSKACVWSTSVPVSVLAVESGHSTLKELRP